MSLFAVAGSSLSKSYIDVVFKVKEKRCFCASIVAHAGNQAGDAVSYVCLSMCMFGCEFAVFACVFIYLLYMLVLRR